MEEVLLLFPWVLGWMGEWGNPSNHQKLIRIIFKQKDFLNLTVVHQTALPINLHKLMRLTDVIHWIKCKVPKLKTVKVS